MPKVPLVSGQEAVKALQKPRYMDDGQKESHVILKKLTVSGELGCVILMHREIAARTLHSALKMAQVEIEAFTAAL